MCAAHDFIFVLLLVEPYLMGKTSQAVASAVNDEVYELEDILEYKIESGKGLWRVRWKGYGPKDDTWEPEGNLIKPGSKLKQRMEESRKKYLASTPEDPALVASRTESQVRSTKRKSGATQKSISPQESPKNPATDEQVPTRASGVKMARKAAEPKQVSSPAPPPPSSSVSDDGNDCEVTHIARSSSDDTTNSYAVTLRWPSGRSETRPVSEVRVKYPDTLLDYLLSRVRFKVSRSFDPRYE